MEIKDKDKIFLVTYVGTDGRCSDEVMVIMDEISNHIRFDETVMHIIIPTPDTSAIRVECINPRNVTDDGYADIMEKISTIQDNVSQIIEQLKNK